MNIFELAHQSDALRRRAGDATVRHILVCGAPGAGKSTWLARYFAAGATEARRAGSGEIFSASALDANATPPRTVALDCFYARRGVDAQTAARLAYIWELGGGGSLEDLIDLVITPATIRCCSVFLFVDLCRPQDISAIVEPLIEALRRCVDGGGGGGSAESARAKLADHTDAAIIRRLGVPFTIVAAKYDIFQNVDSERKRNLWRLLRYLAHINGANLITLSNQIDSIFTRTLPVLNNCAFGGSVQLKSVTTTDFHGPIFVGALADSVEAIGWPRATSHADASRQWAAALADAFAQQPASSGQLLADESDRQQFAEPLIDRLVAEKMRRHYSMFRQESMVEVMNAPLCRETEGKVLKDGPSSQTTVISLAGLLVCSLTLIAAAGIVLVRECEQAFVIVGAAMLGVGLAMLLTMCLLQRKNVAKFYGDLCDDLGFLRQGRRAVAPVHEIYVKY